MHCFWHHQLGFQVPLLKICKLKMTQTNEHQYCLICLNEGHNVFTCEICQLFTPKAWANRTCPLKAALWEKALSSSLPEKLQSLLTWAILESAASPSAGPLFKPPVKLFLSSVQPVLGRRSASDCSSQTRACEPSRSPKPSLQAWVQSAPSERAQEDKES